MLSWTILYNTFLFTSKTVYADIPFKNGQKSRKFGFCVSSTRLVRYSVPRCMRLTPIEYYRRQMFFFQTRIGVQQQRATSRQASRRRSDSSKFLTQTLQKDGPFYMLLYLVHYSNLLCFTIKL